ncbi:MAG: regulatory protein RecX [Syntrophothermus sp.]
MVKITTPPDDAMVMQKIRNFCSFQERYVREVEEKLRDWAVQKRKISSIVQQLKKDNYLNEERFARSYASGKFRNNKWGRVKIEFELSIRGISEELTSKAIQEIPEEDYQITLQNLILSKQKEIKPEKVLNVRDKILNFVSGKGYETSLVIDLMNKLKI